MLLGDTSSSRSPRPLPRTRTTQLHGDRRWQGPVGGNEQYYTAKFQNIPLPRRLVPGTSRWTPGRTWVRHQPPGGQHHCLRCCRRSGFSGAPQSRSSTLCRWSQCSSWSSRRWWNSWWTFSHLSISVLPSRLSKYPTSCPPRAARTVLRAPQTAEQLVEVPTIISYSSLLHVDIPVRGRGGRNVDLQGFLPGQGPTARFSPRTEFILSCALSSCLAQP